MHDPSLRHWKSVSGQLRIPPAVNHETTRNSIPLSTPSAYAESNKTINKTHKNPRHNRVVAPSFKL